MHASLPDGHAFIDLRALAMQGLLPAEDLAILAQARSLLAWHAETPVSAPIAGKRRKRRSTDTGVTAAVARRSTFREPIRS